MLFIEEKAEDSPCFIKVKSSPIKEKSSQDEIYSCEQTSDHEREIWRVRILNLDVGLGEFGNHEGRYESTLNIIIITKSASNLSVAFLSK